jgi:hypothetical protein
MTADDAATLALQLLRHALATHALHGDANAAAMLADVRKRGATYQRTLLGLLLEPLADDAIPYAVTVLGEDGRAA